MAHRCLGCGWRCSSVSRCRRYGLLQPLQLQLLLMLLRAAAAAAAAAADDACCRGVGLLTNAGCWVLALSIRDNPAQAQSGNGNLAEEILAGAEPSDTKPPAASAASLSRSPVAILREVIPLIA